MVVLYLLCVYNCFVLYKSLLSVCMVFHMLPDFTKVILQGINCWFNQELVDEGDRQQRDSELALLGVKISLQTKERLDKEKIHPREPYTEVIDRLLDFMEKHRKK